jgi:hypothetical protein
MRSFFTGAPAKWNLISTAPRGRNVQVQVADNFGHYPLPFLCKMTDKGWVNAETQQPLKLTPTGWRETRSQPAANRAEQPKTKSKAR